MFRVLHLFNLFGALTERSIWENALAIAPPHWQTHIGYETVAPEAPPIVLPHTQLRRVRVEPAEDVDAQMDALAGRIDDPAMAELLRDHESGRRRFDLVHGHFGPRILQAAPWLACGVPMVVSVYGYDAARLLRDPAWAKRYRWAARHGAVFVALAANMFDRLESLGIPRDRLRLIHLGIDLARHTFDPRPAPPVPRFVFVGRFVEKKGAADLIAAAAILRDRWRGAGHAVDTPTPTLPRSTRGGGQTADEPSFVVDLIGSGPLEQSLRSQAIQLGLAGHARFPGTVPFDSLFDQLLGATALVQPSVTAADGDAEGAPMVLMHAQAIGVPCITTRHSGNPEVLPPSAQPYVIPERDPAALADAMKSLCQLASTARQQLQIDGRHWIEAHYDRQTTLAEYRRLYADVTGA